jgi:hypothetical protein
MPLSSEFSVDGNSAVEAIEVAYGATVALAALSTEFRTIEWVVVSTSKADLVAPTITKSGAPTGVTASFTWIANPGDGLGRAIAVACVQTDSQGQTAIAYRIIGTANGQGEVPFVAAEELWRHSTHGWTEMLNRLLSAAGGAGVTDHGALTGLTDVTDHLWAELAARPLVAYAGAASTPVLADARKHITTSHGSANTLTIPPAASVAYDAATLLMGTNIGAGTMTLTAGAGVTVNGSVTVAAHGWWWAKKTNTNTWQTFVGGSSGGTVTAGNGLTDTAGTFSVDAEDATIVVGAGGIKRAPIGGDVVIADGSNTAAIPSDTITYAKIQNVSAASRVIGRGSAAGAGDAEELTPTGGIEVSGTNLQRSALLGDVTAPAGSNTTTIATNAVTTTKILDANVTDAKLASVFVKANGTVAFSAAQSMGGFKLTNLATPTVSADAATKAYVDGVASGLYVKSPVDVVSTTNIASLSGLATTIDGVLQNVDSKRVLLTGQTTASQNGPWEVHSGAWTRPTDFAAGSDAASAFFFVQRGTAFADTGWVCTADAGSAVVGTNNLPFVQFSAAGVITVDSSLVKTGNQLSRAALTGDATAPAGSNVTTITNLAITKLAPSGTNGRVLVTAAGVPTWGFALGNSTDAFTYNGLTHTFSVAGSTALAIGGGSVNAQANNIVTTGVIALGSDPAEAGRIRLSNGDAINWESNPAGTDILGLTVTSANQVVLGSLAAAAVMLDGNLNFYTSGGLRLQLPVGGDAYFQDNSILTTGNLILGADPAEAGRIRLSNGDAINWESNPAGTDILGLTVTSANVFRVGDPAFAMEVRGSAITIGDSTEMIEVASLATNREVISLLLGASLTTTHMPADTGDKVIFVADTTAKPTTGFPLGGGILYCDLVHGLSWKGARGVETTIAPHGDTGNVTKRRMIGFKTDPKRTTLSSTTTTTVASFSVDLLNSQAVTTGSFKLVAHFIATGNSYGSCGERMALLEVTAGTPTVHTSQSTQDGVNANGSPYTAIVIDSSGTTVRLRMTASTVALNVEVFAYFEIMEFEP